MSEAAEADTERANAGASRRVADYLRAAILEGEFGVGEPIRQESLAARLGASRLPVREALRTLEGEGLVSLEPNKGARVTHLDAEELRVLYDARAAIEPIVLADSVPNLTAEHLDRAEAILDQIEAGVDTVEFLVLDREFHLLSYAGCHSVHLRSIVERLWNSTQHYRRAFVTLTGEDWREVTNAEHRLLLHAISTRNAELAGRIIGTHIARTRIALDRHPEIFNRSLPPAAGS
ncbi:MAG: FCD domain-containing protein [Streptosporangiales bacterium]|nr:FCD domain-containing protein [Streptosporangiales bacterium]